MNKRERALRDTAVVIASDRARLLLREWMGRAKTNPHLVRGLDPDYSHAFGLFSCLHLVGLVAHEPQDTRSEFHRLVEEIEQETPLEVLAKEAL